MKIVRHKIHGEVAQPASFTDLIADASKPTGSHSHRVWMWRGQGNIDWRIDSSAYRRLKASTNWQSDDVDANLIRYEQELLKHATFKGYRYESGRELSDFELLARLRHHGAATRLVDFTRSMMVGLWFACYENPNVSGLLIGFDTWYLAGYEREPELRLYDEIVDNLPDDAPATWEPTGISPRMAVQHSQFIYSKISQAKTGSLLFPESHNYRLFKVTPAVKRESIEVLREVFDIDRSVLFPDLDGFSEAQAWNVDISEMHRW